jgi:hypothetical protein
MIDVLYNMYKDKLEKGEGFEPIIYIKKDDKIIMMFIPYNTVQEKTVFRDKLFKKTKHENITECCALMTSVAIHTITKEKRYSFLLVEHYKDGTKHSIVQFYDFDKKNKIRFYN